MLWNVPAWPEGAREVRQSFAVPISASLSADFRDDRGVAVMTRGPRRPTHPLRKLGSTGIAAEEPVAEIA